MSFGRTVLISVFFLVLIIPISLATTDLYPFCTESSEVVDCTGAITADSINITNASIYIHDAVITATANDLFRLNTTHGWINITNVTVNAYGTNSSDGSGCSGHASSADNSYSHFYANDSEPIIITNSTLNGLGGDGGDGGFCQDNSGSLVGGNGGKGGNGEVIFFSGSEINLTNVIINGYGGLGGTGGATLDDNQDLCTICGGACSARGGNGGSGGSGNITFYMNYYLENTLIYSYGGGAGNGGLAKTADNNDGYHCTGGDGGSGGISTFYSNYSGTLRNSTIISYSGSYGSSGTYFGGSGSECICTPLLNGVKGNNGNSYFDILSNKLWFLDKTILNISVGSAVDKTGRSYGYFESDIEFVLDNSNFTGTQPATNYHILNLTNSTEARLALFNGSDILSTIYVYCDAENITIGNDSSLDTDLDFTYCPAYQDGNITYTDYDTFFAIEEAEIITITLNSPQDTYYSDAQLNVSYIPESSRGNDFNITLYINGTANNTSLNIANGTTDAIESVGLPNGTFSWIIEACSNDSNCENTTARTFYLDDTVPSINFFEPGVNGNITPYNLSSNISVSGEKLETINYTIFYSNNTKYWSNFTESPTSPFTLNNSVTFTIEDNYTINVTANNTAGGSTTRITYYYFDMTAPILTITSPTGTLSSQTVSLTTTIEENSSYSCWYRVTDSNLNPEVSKKSYNCTSASFSVSADGNYLIFFNATDGVYTTEINSSFTVDTATAPETPASPGGGSVTTVVVSEEDIEYEIQSESGGSSYSFYINPGGFRKKEIKVINKKEPLNGLKFECLGESCDLISFDEEIVTVPAKKTEFFYFNVNIPENTPIDDYNVRIKATYTAQNGQEYPSFLIVFINVRNWGKLFNPICFSLEDGFNNQCSKGLPIWAALLLLWFFMTILFSTLPLTFIDDPDQRKYVPAVGVSLSIILIIFITILII